MFDISKVLLYNIPLIVLCVGTIAFRVLMNEPKWAWVIFGGSVVVQMIVLLIFGKGTSGNVGNDQAFGFFAISILTAIILGILQKTIAPKKKSE